MPSPAAVQIELTAEERDVLQGAWARRGKTAQALALRARIVLACCGWLVQQRGLTCNSGSVATDGR